MSIVVYKLSKHFQEQAVVDQLSFSVEKGQVLGFLGPNGAGKSTTMRMITGYLKPSEGGVYICDYDITKHPRQARKKIGYLPEHNPLYLTMYVHEYLRFMGSIHGLSSKQCIAKAKEIVGRCGISEMQNNKLGTLSKGYRQRIGLAQALIHNPAVLILDEPTTGLDPNQLHEIRSLIREVSQEKAVILSTHIMQEVEALCDRVVIINQGKLCIEATLEELVAQSSAQLTVTFQEPIPLAALERLADVARVQVLDKHKCKIYANRSRGMHEALFRFAQENSLTIQRLELKKALSSF
ncbi:MAG: ATP-binding cassette domain-containing protein [Bacteroidota bacterium]